jgi:hypothetical protein
MPQDLEHLDLYGIGKGFRLIGLTACAAKLRLMRELGSKRISSMYEQLRIRQSDYLARPFGAWHRNSFVQMLCVNEQQLRTDNVSINGFLSRTKEHGPIHFQKEARLQIRRIRCTFDLENRVRQKLARWKLQGPPAHVSGRCVRVLGHLSKVASPAICAGYLRTIFNGWPTSARMRSMQGAGPIMACLFGCSASAEDRIEHYARCPVVWQFLSAAWPNGPGTNLELKGIDAFFGLCKGMSEERWLLTAKAVHAVGKVVMYRRHAVIAPESNHVQALRMEWRKLT